MKKELLTINAMQVRKYRRKKGLTGEELANLTGLSRTIISQYETGVTLPTHKNLIKLAQALDCEPKDLIF